MLDDEIQKIIYGLSSFTKLEKETRSDLNHASELIAQDIKSPLTDQEKAELGNYLQALHDLVSHGLLRDLAELRLWAVREGRVFQDFLSDLTNPSAISPNLRDAKECVDDLLDGYEKLVQQLKQKYDPNTDVLFSEQYIASIANETVRQLYKDYAI